MVNVGKKRRKLFAFFSAIVLVCLLIGMIGFVSADCAAGKKFYKIIDAQGHTSSTDFKEGYGKEDPVAYQSSTGNWIVLLSGSGYSQASATFGGAGWSPTLGDYDGDGKEDPAVYQPSTGVFKVALSGSGYTEAGVTFGGPGYIPLLGDYDGECIIPSGYAEFNPICTTGKTCAADYPGKCGSSLDDGCGGKINCASNCGAGVCKSDGTCCIPNCASTGHNCGNDGCGGSCGTCLKSNPPKNGEFLCSHPETGGVCTQAYWWYPDCDGDGYGNNDTSKADFLISTRDGGPTCLNYFIKENHNDCNDRNKSINLTAIDICDGIDNNCNNKIDEEGCINSANWKNLLGVNIDRTQVNDTILMSITGTNLTSNEVSYTLSTLNSTQTIWETITDWIFQRTPDLLYSYSPLWVVDGIVDNAYRFNASIIKNNVLVTKKGSSSISIFKSNNSLPVGIISYPANELNITAGTNIIFNQSSYDEDDLLKITWDFGDGTTKVITNYLNNSAIAGNSNFNTSANAVHNYSSSGRYTVRLTVEEMEKTGRGQRDSDSIVINVFSPGINVFPVVSKPNETAVQEKVVRFDASKSFVAKCLRVNLDSKDIIVSGTNSLNCTYIHNPKKTSTDGYTLTMNWTINGDSSPIQLIGDWSTDYSDVVVFNKAFSKNGEHNFSLNMSYTADSAITSGKLGRDFNVMSVWKCEADTDGSYYWTDDKYTVRNNCSYKQGELGYSCCPSGKYCSSDGSCRGYARYCFQYTSKSSCENYVNYVPDTSVSSKALCGIKQNYYLGNDRYCSNMTNCLCKWNSSSDECVEGINYTRTCWTVDDDPDIITSQEYGECLWSSQITNNCNNSNNNILAQKRALWVNNITSKPEWCKDSQTIYQCAVTEKLPFFDNLGLIIAIILILAVYFFVLQKQKKIKEKINVYRHKKRKSGK
jgi:hypothetical protein